jgi:hypothetical protein
MRWELDHVFMATPDPGVEAVASAFGLTFTSRRVHTGQGTANSCAVFENAYLELLFPATPEELESEVVHPLGLKERINWKTTGACPFGVCFRAVDVQPGAVTLPFETWPYRPAYLPPGTGIPVVTPRRSLFEPLVFLLNRPRAPDSVAGVLHRGSRRTVTALSIHSAHDVASPGVRWFMENGLLSVSRASDYLLEIVWDHATEGQSERLAAPLPLAISW